MSKGFLSSCRLRLNSPQLSAFLDHETAKIDKLVDDQKRLVELLKEKRQAVISYAVTKGLDPNAPMKHSGVEWLGEVPAQWKMARVKNLSLQISKGTTPTTVGADFVETGIRFLKAENISEGKVSVEPEFFISPETHALLSRSNLYAQDVLAVIAGATTGRSAVLTADLLPANANQAVAFIRCRNKDHAVLIDLWLSSAVVQEAIKRASVQSAQPNLAMEDLGNIPIPLPPPPEQTEITTYLGRKMRDLGAFMSNAEVAIGLLQERRSALISAAVTGKIDVRGLVRVEVEAA